MLQIIGHKLKELIELDLINSYLDVIAWDIEM